MSSSRFLVEATGKHRKSSRNVMKSEVEALTEFWQREAFHREDGKYCRWVMQMLTFFRVFIQAYLDCVHAYCSLVRLLSIGRPAVERRSYEIFWNNDSVKQTN